MFKTDIENAFTSKVVEHLQSGWIIDVDSMSGSQGEKAKVNVRKGDIVRCIVLVREYKSFAKVMALRVMEQKVKYSYEFDRQRTVWLSKGTKIEETLWYEVSRYGSYYFVTEDEYNNIEFIRFNRSALKNTFTLDNEIYTSDTYRKVVLNRVKREPRCKTKTLKDIKSIEVIRDTKNNARTNYYIVLTNGTRIRLR